MSHKFHTIKVNYNPKLLEQEAIFRIYNHRCIMCGHFASEINEIDGRARNKDNIKNRKNRVPLCPPCHREFHHNGVTPEKIKDMKERRVEFLLMLGKESEI